MLMFTLAISCLITCNLPWFMDLTLQVPMQYCTRNKCGRLWQHTSMAKRSYPTSEVRGGSREELPHVRGQGQWPRGATPRPRSGVAAEKSNPMSMSSGSMGSGGPRGATPRSRSGGVEVRRYPLFKVRSRGCTLLGQPWRDTPHPS